MGVQKIELIRYLLICYSQILFTINFIIVGFILINIGFRLLRLYKLANRMMNLLNLLNVFIIYIWTVHEIIPRFDRYIAILTNQELGYIALVEAVLPFILFHIADKLYA